VQALKENSALEIGGGDFRLVGNQENPIAPGSRRGKNSQLHPS
jgi:hypothetical protein